jgi:hypothetical protein
MLLLHARRLVALTALAGRVKAVEGAAPRFLRPMYARANMGHPSREAGIVVLLKRRWQALLPNFPFATVRSVGRGVNAKQAEGKASVHEGHGFSRAVKGLPTTALAAEVRFSTYTGQVISLRGRVRGRRLEREPQGPQGLKPSSVRARCGTAEPVPFVHQQFKKLWRVRQ